MKTFLSISGTTCARSACGPWPCCCWPASSPCRWCSRSPRGPAARPADGLRAARGSRAARAQGAGRGQARGGRHRGRLVAEHLRPEQPVRAAAKVVKESEETAGPAPARPRSDGLLLFGGDEGSTGTTGGGDTGGGDTGGTGDAGDGDGGTTTKTKQYTYVIDVTFRANGRTRKIKGMEKLDMLPNEASPLLLFLGVVGATPATRSSWSTRRSTPRARAAASRAALSAPSSTWAPGPSTSSPTRTATRTGCASTRSARSRSSDGRRGKRCQAVGRARPARRRTDRRARRFVPPIICRPRERVQPTAARLNRRRGPPIGGRACAASLTICLLALSAVALLATAPAAVAAKKSKAPARDHARHADARQRRQAADDPRHATSSASARRNTVIFRGPKRPHRVREAAPRQPHQARRARSRRPWRACSTVGNSRQRPTRLKLRVLAGKFSKYTTRRLSPVVTGVGEGDGPAARRKTSARTTPTTTTTCCRTTSRARSAPIPASRTPTATAMTDGWEYYAAKDLNIKARALPGQAALPERARPVGRRHGRRSSAIDFDGDGLTTREEYRAWRYTGSSFDAAKVGGLDLESPLGYSDGTSSAARARPRACRRGAAPSYGLPNPTQPSRRPTTCSATAPGATTSATPTPTA